MHWKSYSPSQDKAVVIVTRDGDPSHYADLKIQGLNAWQTYSVHFQNDPRMLTMSGVDLMNDGVRVSLPDPQSSEIVYVGY